MENDIVRVTAELLAKYNRPVPRYTSYPTAPQFTLVEKDSVEKRFASFDATLKPLSLYVHIPFCKTMCLFCGCSVVLNRKPERQSLYLEHLLQEIRLVAGRFSKKRRVTQLHLGGGTPTSLTEEELSLLMQTLQEHFLIAPEAEVSIEVDPRTVHADQGKKLALLKQLGFNRVSFGVQDLDPVVQEAIKRRQSEAMTVETVERAKSLGFSGINVDLIYGLPFQTVERFNRTVDRLISLRPDRVALYSYAKVPWLKAHQRAIPDATLPSVEEKFQIYSEARARFMQSGYTAIGMDHFSLKNDSLSFAYKEKKLMRNFQGYSIQLAEDMIGFGITAIGFLENSYFQNYKDLETYQAKIGAGNLPIEKGFFLSPEDIRRKAAIQALMCHFELDKNEYRALVKDDIPVREGLVEERSQAFVVTPLGRLFIRLVAASFDAYLGRGKFSSAV